MIFYKRVKTTNTPKRFGIYSSCSALPEASDAGNSKPENEKWILESGYSCVGDCIRVYFRLFMLA